MYSKDGLKQFIIGVYTSRSWLNRPSKTEICVPGETSIFVLIYPHLDWIFSLLGDERCISNASRWGPRKFAHLSATVLAILSFTLIVYLNFSGSKKQTANIVFLWSSLVVTGRYALLPLLTWPSYLSRTRSQLKWTKFLTNFYLHLFGSSVRIPGEFQAYWTAFSLVRLNSSRFVWYSHF